MQQENFTSDIHLHRQLMSRHTETEVAVQIHHLTQSLYLDTRPTSSNTDPSVLFILVSQQSKQRIIICFSHAVQCESSSTSFT